MLFAMGLCRGKHVKPLSTDVSRTTITETAKHCARISPRNRDRLYEYWHYSIPQPFILSNTRDEYQQTVLVVLSTREAD